VRAISALILLAACSQPQPAAKPPPPQDPWQKTLQDYLAKQPAGYGHEPPEDVPRETWDKRLGEYLQKRTRESRVVETLAHPVKIEGWTESGLLPEGGGELPLPGLRALPMRSASLAEATARGVEKSGGRVYGLVRVNHWDPDDPIREHVARVDLSRLLQFLAEGESSEEVPRGLRKKGGTFTAAGWRVEEFDMFQVWLKVHPR
jgi:hypothetical protein